MKTFYFICVKTVVFRKTIKYTFKLRYASGLIYAYCYLLIIHLCVKSYLGIIVLFIVYYFCYFII